MSYPRILYRPGQMKKIITVHNDEENEKAVKEGWVDHWLKKVPSMEMKFSASKEDVQGKESSDPKASAEPTKEANQPPKEDGKGRPGKKK